MTNLTLKELEYKINKEKNDNDKLKQLLTLAILTGGTMLKFGAETYRVEDTVKRICKSRLDVDFAHIFVIPTAIFVSIERNGEPLSYLKRVSPSSINLNIIHLTNEFSRKFVNSNMSIEEGIKEIKKIGKIQLYSPRQRVIFASLITSTFAGLFNGSFMDMVTGFIITCITMSITKYIYRFKFIGFIENFIAGFISGILAGITFKLKLVKSMDTVIISVIMPLLPGYALTNAIRDAISGDHLSSLSRGLDAILSGTALALGVGFAIKFVLGVII